MVGGRKVIYGLHLSLTIPRRYIPEPSIHPAQLHPPTTPYRISYPLRYCYSPIFFSDSNEQHALTIIPSLSSG